MVVVVVCVCVCVCVCACEVVRRHVLKCRTWVDGARGGSLRALPAPTTFNAVGLELLRVSLEPLRTLDTHKSRNPALTL